MYRKYLLLFFFFTICLRAFSNSTAAADTTAQPITICSAAPIVIQGDVESPVPNTYLWQVLQGNTWVTAPGAATFADYTASKLINNTNASILFSIRRQIVVSGSIDYDSFYDVTILPSAPVSNNNITAPAVTMFCTLGTPGKITGTIASGGNGAVAYQWQSSTDNVNFININGATAVDYSPFTVTTTTYYRRTSSAGSCVAASVSNTVAIIIYPIVAANLITVPTISNFCTPGDPSVIIGNTPTGGNGVYTYQWQSSADNSTFADIPGANSINYDPPILSGTTYFRRSAVSGPCNIPVYSNVVLISIFPALGNNTIAAPAVIAFCVSGDAASITGSNPSGGNGTYGYQWQQSTDMSNFTNIAGATGINYDPPLSGIPMYYRRIVISGQCTVPVLSNLVFINILPTPVAPTALQATVLICPGATASLSVGSPQTGLNYNWYDSATKNTLLFTGTTFITPALNANTTYYIESSNGVCSNSSLSPVQVLITPPIAINNNTLTLPVINSFCTPSNPAVITGSTPGGGDGNYTYQWQNSTDNITFADIIGAIAKDYDPATTNVTTYFRRLVKSGACSTPIYSSAVAISIFPALANNSISAPAVISFCVSGDPLPITGTAPTGGNVTYGYQWQQSTDNLNFTDISGATAINFDPPVINVSTYYRRIVTSGQCTAPFLSNVVLFNILPVPAVPIVDQTTVSICPGSIATLAVNSPQPGLVYNWYDSAARTTLLFTGTTYVTPAQTASKTYFVESSNGVCTNSALSSVQVVISLPIAITNNILTLPVINSFCTPGDPAVIVGSLPAGGDGNYTYQWQSSTDNITFINIIGEVAKDYDPALISTTTYFRRMVSSGACSAPSFSAAVSVVIYPALANNTITTPTLSVFCVAGDFGVIPGSTPTGGSGTYSYQWQQSTDNLNFTNIVGAINMNYAPGSLISTSTYFRRVVTSGQCTAPLLSNGVFVSILPMSPAPVPTQSTVAVCSNSIATLSVSSPQPGLVYNWYDSATRTNLLFTGITYVTPPQTANTIYYVESSNGVCAGSTLSTVQVIITAPVAITGNVITAPAINSFCSSSDPAAIDGNLPSGGTGNFSYQWQSSTDNVTFTDITGATLASYDPPQTNVTTYFRRAVISGTCAVPFFSNVVTISIFTPIANNVITAPAVSSFCILGDPSVITGTMPTGGNGAYTYQWQQSSDNLYFVDINGATASSYDPPVIGLTIYYRRLVISGQCTPPLVSNIIPINIVTIPSTAVPTQPVVTICAGSVTSLSISNAQPGLIYNWYDSATKTNLLFTGTTYVTPALTAATTYYVDVSNGACSGLSLASVQVNISAQPGTPILAATAINTCSGSNATVSVANPQAGLTYNWYSSVSGGVPSFTGASFTTPALNADAIYYVEAVNTTGCSSLVRASVNVGVLAAPVLSVQGVSTCVGSAATLTATANISGATFNWYTNAVGGTAIFTGGSFTTPALSSSTSYYVEAVNNVTGCISASRQLAQVTVLQPLAAPVITLTATTGNSITFSWTAVSNAAGYQFSIDNGLSFHNPTSGSNGLTTTVGGLKGGESVTILVRAIGATACQISANSAAVTGIAVNYSDEVYIPNAFTPNGDGVNDVVHVHSESIKTFTFYIYDQWGEMIFSSSALTSGWDGTYKGTREPAGVYIYYLKALMNSGDQLNKKGTITLLR